LTASARLPVAETRPEHFDRALADGKVSTNVYLRRIHNHALGMEWLLKSVIPRLQWPKPVFKAKRAITAEEHAAIVQRGEQNAERRDFYELLWHTGASQTDAACLLAEDVNWNSRTISYSRAKLKSRWHWHQTGADSVRGGDRGPLETASGGCGPLVSVSSHRAGRRPGDGIQATVPGVEDFGVSLHRIAMRGRNGL
jgi:hypothetical protein